MKQLSAEWKAILARIQETAAGKAVPFVAKALCLVDLTVDPKVPAYKEIDRNLIVDRGDLAAFEITWGRLVGGFLETSSRKYKRTNGYLL